jgi:hypothetical protein
MEGSPLTIDQEKVATIRHKLAPVAVFAIEAFFREKQAGRA